MTIDVQALRNLLSRATAGEWAQSHRSDANGMHSTEVYDAEGQTIAVCAWHPVKIDGGWTTDRAANAALIAAAKNSMAALLDAYEERERLRAIVERTAAHFDGTDAPLGMDARAALKEPSNA